MPRRSHSGDICTVCGQSELSSCENSSLSSIPPESTKEITSCRKSSLERVAQFRHMFLTIFSTILCKIIVHQPNKHHIKVCTSLSTYIIVVTFHVNKWRHRRDRILSGFARHAAGCCPHNSAYLKEINHLCVKMKQVGYFSSESFCFMLIYKRNTKERYLSIWLLKFCIVVTLIIEILHCCDRSLQKINKIN